MELEGWEDRGRSGAGEGGWFGEKIKTKILRNGNVSSSRLRALLEAVTKLKWLNLFHQINFCLQKLYSI